MNNASKDLSSKLLGVVLNGGKSTRMRHNKASLRLENGDSFLEHAIQRMQLLCSNVVISTGSQISAGQARRNITSLPDTDEFQQSGPLAGIATCVKYAITNNFHACLFTPIDLPNLSAQDLQQVRKRWSQSPLRPVCVENQSSGLIEPLVSIIPIGMCPSIIDALTKGELSVHRWLSKKQPLIVQLHGSSLENINTPEDLDSVLSRKRVSLLNVHNSPEVKAIRREQVKKN